MNKHFQRVNILESFYTQIISEKQKKSNQLVNREKNCEKSDE